MKNKLKLTSVILLLLGFSACNKKESYNIVELDASIHVRNLTDKDYLDTLVNVGLQELKQRHLYITIKPLVITSSGDYDLRGYIEGYGNTFIIYVEDNTRDSYPLLIAHELIHLKQYTSGRLVIYTGGIIFDNIFYPNSTPYQNRPYEIEAFRLDDELAAKIMGRLNPPSGR